MSETNLSLRGMQVVLLCMRPLLRFWPSQTPDDMWVNQATVTGAKGRQAGNVCTLQRDGSDLSSMKHGLGWTVMGTGARLLKLRLLCAGAVQLTAPLCMRSSMAMVLVIDDQAPLGTLLRIVLERAGHEETEAPNGRP